MRSKQKINIPTEEIAGIIASVLTRGLSEGLAAQNRMKNFTPRKNATGGNTKTGMRRKVSGKVNNVSARDAMAEPGEVEGCRIRIFRMNERQVFLHDMPALMERGQISVGVLV